MFTTWIKSLTWRLSKHKGRPTRRNAGVPRHGGRPLDTFECVEDEAMLSGTHTEPWADGLPPRTWLVYFAAGRSKTGVCTMLNTTRYGKRWLNLSLALALVAAGGLALPFTASAEPPDHAKGGGGNGGGDDGGGEVTNPAFVFSDDSGLSVSSVDDSQRLMLTDPPQGAYDISPVWSPDLDSSAGYQGQIAFLRRPDEEINQLFVINPDGSNPWLVTEFRYPEDSPNGWDGFATGHSLDWSPNGRELVYAASDGCLWAVEVATGFRRCLLGEQELRSPRTPSVSGPRQQIVFDDRGALWLIDFTLDENGRLQVDPATLFQYTDVAEDDINPAWSPSGQFLSVTRLSSDRGAELVVRDLWNGSETTVVVDSGIRSSTWSPDGLELAYSTVRETGRGNQSSADIYVVTNWWDANLRTLALATDTTKQDETEPDWSPGYIPAP